MQKIETLEYICAFGIELKKVREEDLQLICHWRNHPSILPYMEEKREVGLNHLHFWFMKIDKDKTAFPYIAYLKDKPIAYTEIKNIQYSTHSAFDGLFVFGSEIAGTGISYNIVLSREIIVSALGVQDLFSMVHAANADGNCFVRNYGGDIIEQKGFFNLYRHEFSKRRKKLKEIAGYLRMDDEYNKYFES